MLLRHINSKTAPVSIVPRQVRQVSLDHFALLDSSACNTRSFNSYQRTERLNVASIELNSHWRVFEIRVVPQISLQP